MTGRGRPRKASSLDECKPAETKRASRSCSLKGDMEEKKSQKPPQHVDKEKPAGRAKRDTCALPKTGTAEARATPKTATCQTANCAKSEKSPKETPDCKEEKTPRTITIFTRQESKEKSVDAVLLRTLDKLKIKRDERSEAARVVNGIIKDIMDHLKKNTQCFKDISDLRTGSYYENLKISNPDEFDVMMTVPIDRVDLQRFGDDGAFYSVALKRGESSLKQFMQEDNTLSAYGMLKEFRKEVKKCVRTMKDVEIEKKKVGCPAVTLAITGVGLVPISLDVVLGIEVRTSWPAFTEGGFQIDDWLGTKVKRQLKLKPYYLVPKHEGRGSAERDGVLAKDVWRISFSHVEKEIVTNHGSDKTCCEKGQTRCCRKGCLKLLKHLLGLLKEEDASFGKFCSYHAKTTFFHACCSRYKDSDWEAPRLRECFMMLLKDFEDHLRDFELQNFFIPTQNLFSGPSNKSCKSLAQRIRQEWESGFPIFLK